MRSLCLAAMLVAAALLQPRGPGFPPDALAAQVAPTVSRTPVTTAPELPASRAYHDLAVRPLERDIAPVLPAAPAPTTRADRIMGAALLASLGSFAGLHAGGSLADSYGSPDREAGQYFEGAVVGSWLGAAVGSIAAQGNPVPAMIGSAGGMLAGIAIGLFAARVDTNTGLMAYSVVHGTITALIGSS